MCVDAFGGLPGVDTAYYCTQFGYEKSDANNVRALLEQCRASTNRRAAMVSTLVAVRSPQDPAADRRGPAWWARSPPNRAAATVLGSTPSCSSPNLADLCRAAVEVKNAHSHRGRSAAANAGP